MPPLLSSCTKAAAFISAAYCLMFGSVAARVTRRTAVRRKQCQHIPAVFSPAFLLPISASGTAHVLRTLPRRPKRIQQHKLIRRHRAVATASLVPSIQQLRERDRVCNVHNSLLGVGISIGRSSSSSSSTRRRRSLLPAHTDTAAQHASVSPSSLPSKPTAPSNVVVLALGSNTDDLERCQRLAQHLGVSLVVRGREDGPDKQEEGQKGEQEEKHQQQERSRKRRQSKGGGADGESRDFKFTMMFDESGRLALGQPGSGFNPLVVRHVKVPPALLNTPPLFIFGWQSCRRALDVLPWGSPSMCKTWCTQRRRLCVHFVSGSCRLTRKPALPEFLRDSCNSTAPRLIQQARPDPTFRCLFRLGALHSCLT